MTTELGLSDNGLTLVDRSLIHLSGLALVENRFVPDKHFLHYAAGQRLDERAKSLYHKHDVSSTFHTALALYKVSSGALNGEAT